MSMGFSLSINLSIEPYAETVLPRTYKYLEDNDIILDIPEELDGVTLRGKMDAVLVYILPIFKEEVLEFYLNNGKNLLQRYGWKGCRKIDSMLYKVIKTVHLTELSKLSQLPHCKPVGYQSPS
jgi:hypothetical protein